MLQAYGLSSSWCMYDSIYLSITREFIDSTILEENLAFTKQWI